MYTSLLIVQFNDCHELEPPDERDDEMLLVLCTHCCCTSVLLNSLNAVCILSVTTAVDVNEMDVENEDTVTEDLPLALLDIPSPTCEQLVCLCQPQYHMSLPSIF